MRTSQSTGLATDFPITPVAPPLDVNNDEDIL